MATWNDDDELLRLATGKELYLHLGIIGLSPDLRASHGYDGGVFDFESVEWSELTKTELIEIADLMIERWNQFKERAEIL